MESSYYRVSITKGGVSIEVESSSQDFVESKLGEFMGDGFTVGSFVVPDASEKNSAEAPESLDISSGDSGAQKPLSFEELIKGARPRNGTDFVVVAGYYLEKFEGKSSFTTRDITKCFRTAKFPHSNPSQAVAGARSGALLMTSVDGKGYQLTQTGEQRAIDMLQSTDVN